MKNQALIIFLFLIGFYYSSQTNYMTTLHNNRLDIKEDTFKIGNKVFIVTESTKKEYENNSSFRLDTSENNRITKDFPSVKRIKDTLIIQFNNKSTKWINGLETNNLGQYFARYFYIGKFSDINKYCIIVEAYESSLTLLIDCNNGDTTEVCGIPTISPDKKYFVCSEYTGESGFACSGIELYENSSKISLIGYRAPTTWSADGVKWIDDSTFLLKRYYRFTNDSVDFVKLKMTK